MKNTSKVLLGNFIATILSILVCLFFREKGYIALIYGIIAYYSLSSIAYMIMYKRSNFLNKPI